MMLIPKRRDATKIKDYIPISLVHSFSKLFTKMIANRLHERLAEIFSMKKDFA
jgi:hypothetical protein